MNMLAATVEEIAGDTLLINQEEDTKDNLIKRLTWKVSSQATELQELSNQLEVTRHLNSSTGSSSSALNSKYASREYDLNATIESNLNHGDSLDASRKTFLLSSTASQRRFEKDHHESMVAMQRQLDAAEAKLADHIKSRRKLIQDFDAKNRESKFLIKRCQELQSENEKMRAQMEHALKLKENSVLALQQKDQHGLTADFSRSYSAGGKLSIGLTPKQLSLRTSDKVYQQQLLEELKMHQQLLRDSNGELTDAKEREQQHRLKIKVLEDALEFRSEEIGLAGHSDLLAKVAKLRGEVTALKSELKSKRDRISECEENKSELLTTHEQNAQQIKLLQQRLAEAQRDTYRLQQGDVGQMLKTAEEERDKLLAFVQGDMQKSTLLARQVEQLESDLRISKSNHSFLEDKCRHLEDDLAQEKQRAKLFESKADKETRQLSELQRTSENTLKEKDSVRNQLDRKSVEVEELNKVQMNLFMQLQNKDEELLKRNEEIAQMKAQLRDFEYSVPGLKSDHSRLQQELIELREALSIAQRSLREAEPELERLRPETSELRAERGNWKLERSELKQQLASLIPLQRLLDDLNQGLLSMDQITGAATGSSPDGTSESKVGTLEELAMRSPSPFLATPLGMPTPLSTTAATAAVASNTRSPQQQQQPSLSQKHALWVALPSLRNLSGVLYEKIRSIAHDLHVKETQCYELQRSLLRLRNEVNIGRQESDQRAQQLLTEREDANHSIATLRQRLATAEAEVGHNRGAKTLLEQIKVVLASYPSNWSELMQQQQQEYDGSDLIHRIHADATSGNAEFINEKVADQMLPDLIGKALMHNASAVRELAQSQHKLHALEAELQLLQRELENVQREKLSADNLVFDLKDKLSIASGKIASSGHDFADRLGEAADLAEKQNALTISMEAKIEALHRDQKLKAAQITALQQRDSSLRSRLLATLQESCLQLGVPSPAETSKLVDLLQLNAMLLRRACAAAGVTAMAMAPPVFHDASQVSNSRLNQSTPKASRSSYLATSSGSGSSHERNTTRKKKKKSVVAAASTSKPRTTSKSNPQSQSAAALQERLRSAQQAFAAMKESSEF